MLTVFPYYHNVCQAPFTPEGGLCVFTPPKTNGNACPATPNPINTATGNKFMAETSYRGTGVFPLELSLHYNSAVRSPNIPNASGVNDPSPLARADHDPSLPQLAADQVAFDSVAAIAPGTGWQHNYHRSVIAQPNGLTATVSRPDGKIHLFTLTNGTWSSDADVNGKLTRLIDSNAVSIGWQYTNPEDEIGKNRGQF
jgi:hypothetical protein